MQAPPGYLRVGELDAPPRPSHGGLEPCEGSPAAPPVPAEARAVAETSSFTAGRPERPRGQYSERASFQVEPVGPTRERGVQERAE